MKTQSNPVPAFAMWACNHLGDRVTLVKDWDVYEDGQRILKAGIFGRLYGIQRHSVEGARAVVEFDFDDSELVDLPFNRIKPI